MSRSLGTFSARLAHIRRLPVRLRIAALGEGLLACSPDESEALALELLELAVLPAFAANDLPVRAPRLLSLIRRIRRAQSASVADAALAEISRVWAFIPSSVVPAAIAAGKDRWKAVIRQVTTDPSRFTQISLAKLTADSRDVELAPLAAAMLHDNDDQVAQSAERSLLRLCLTQWRQDLAQTTAS